ncbi:acid protease [Pluteus cervinus]|uniref:Acid protease n=1 Tax=Pluteus cervinus TaxID=181527 RepID=A0ACD3AQ66_9AGAR|nr:acid protease [Pluteus cervinus]
MSPSFLTVLSRLAVLIVVVQVIPSNYALPHQATKKSSLWTRRPGGFDLPITRHVVRERRKRGALSGSIGLGNNGDLLYTVPVELGNTVAAVNLDTGSSDLWVITDKCVAHTCRGANDQRYPSAGMKTVGADVKMLYGDSTTGTFASGVVAQDVAVIAGIAIDNQMFAAINDTSNTVVQFGTSGIFGLGFPSGSKVQEAVVTQQSGPIDQTDDFVRATYDQGPLLSRISMTGALQKPMFSITLQRDTIDISGQGVLSVGKLPDGVDESSLTWVPVRLYKPQDGGLSPPAFAPNEVYPFRWEIDIDAVFLDGQRIADSKIPAEGGVDSTRVTALIDTGNSLLRGPQDVVNNILSTVSSTYNPNAQTPVAEVPCAVPRTLAFQIGGKLFPVDPRDFLAPIDGSTSTTTCVADNLVSTDPPNVGATFRWSLGDPFMKSNLVAFHYGNLTNPSVDPPMIGFMSMVPSNAGDLLKQAVQDAQETGGFEKTLDLAPTQSAAAEGEVTVSQDFAVQTSAPSSTGNSVNTNANIPSSRGFSIFTSVPATSVLVGIVVCFVLL